VTVVVPDGARELLGEAYGPMERYAALLLTGGVERGLIGPNEAPRLWERHLLNSAAVVGLVPKTATVVDLGSGAGLPGVVLAIQVPSLRVILLDATKRRTDFLTEVVAELGLGDRVEVVWGRAEALPSFHADVVVARAVAPLSKLAGWALPHLIGGGSLLAMKGESAAEELNRDAAGLPRLGAISTELVSLPSLGSEVPVHVIRVVKGSRTGPVRKPRPQSSKPASARQPSRRTLPRSTSTGTAARTAERE
jgi:16S rRNA (guanine527-N7)-methyltransferase